MKRVISLTLSIFLLLGCVLPVFAADGVPTSVMEATKSVVRILSVYSNGSSTGSGFVIKNEPGEVLIVTNDHVVEGNPSKISVWVSENRLVEAEIVFTTSERDLCVLKLNGKVDMKPLKLSREEPQHGAAIYAVGFPGAGDILSDTKAHTSDSATITDGIISAIRSFTIEKGGKPVKLLQVNAAINSGNSGGPLFNKKGEVIGINTYKVNAESQGVFGSVAVSELWNLLDKHDIAIPEVKVTKAVNPVWFTVGGAVLVVLLIVKKRRSKPKTSSKKDKKSQETENLVTLSDYVRRWPSGLGIGRAVSLLLPAAIQLRNLHNDGKLHLQISPDTILVNSFGKETSLKEPAGQETARFNSGFAAPEIYKGAGFGIASDVYSFGAVLYYAVTGRIPSNSLQQELLEQDFVFLPEEGFAAVIRKAMAFETFSRTQSMQELIYGISAFTAVSRTAPAKVQSAPMKKAEIEDLLPKKQEVSVPVRQQKAEADRLTDIAEKEAKSRASLQTEAKKPVVTAAPEEKPEPVKKTEQKKTAEKKTAPKKKNRKWIPVTIVLGLVCAAAVLLMQKEEPVSLQNKPTTSVGTTAAVQLSPEAVKYNEAVDLFKNEEYGKAAIAFAKLGDYRDAQEISKQIWDAIAKRNTISAGRDHVVGIKNDGTLVACGKNSYGQCNVEDITDAIAVSAGGGNTFVLKSDGTVTCIGWIHSNVHLEEWENIVSIWADGNILLGLKSDGTIMISKPDFYDCYGSISEWIQNSSDNVFIEPGVRGPIVMKSDGTVEDFNGKKQWTDIISITSASSHLVGLKSDGTIVKEALHENPDHDLYTDEWTDIVEISGSAHLLGLESDGTVVATGRNFNKECEVDNWENIVSVGAGWLYSVGLKSDGTVVRAGTTQNGLSSASKWSDIKLPADRDALLAQIKVAHITSEDTLETMPSGLSPEATAYNEAVRFFKNEEYGKAAIAFAKLGDYRDAREISFRIWDVVADRRFIDSGHMHTVGVKADGTVVSVGSSSDGRTDVGSLADVVAITAGQFHTIALHADGTVSALGDIGRNTCEVDDWTNIVQVLSYTGRTFAGGIFGLKSDGTLVATHDLNEMAEWHDLIAFDFGIGLKSDGTVIQVKNPYFDVTHWNNITAISRSGAGHIIGLKSDGTVMATGVHYNGTACDCDVSEWNDIIAVSAGTNHLLGLKSDGTVVAAGANSSNQCNVDTWTDIVAIRTGNVTAASYGIKSDGTVVTAGSVKLGNVIHSEWNDIKLPADRDALLAQIKVEYITDSDDVD